MNKLETDMLIWNVVCRLFSFKRKRNNKRKNLLLFLRNLISKKKTSGVYDEERLLNLQGEKAATEEP